MAKILLCLLFFGTVAAEAQQIAVPKTLIAGDSTTFPAIADIAKQVIPLYKDSDKGNYLENIFRFYLAAGKYRETVEALDSENILYNDKGASGIQFRSYAAAKAAGMNLHKMFPELYVDTLAAIYERLPPREKPKAATYFGGDLKKIKESLGKKLEKIADRDSISLTEAESIARTYASFCTYHDVQDLGRAFFAADDARRYIINDSVLIKMKDGAQLSAVIVRNRLMKEPLPVILLYNIYASDQDLADAKTAANCGYVGMVVNTRGKKGSPQEIEPYEHDGADAYEAIDWISKQSWCNGSVGMYGGSYLGFSQWSATKKLHPALKTIVPQVAVVPGIEFPVHNGIFRNYILRWLHYVSNNKLTDDADFNDPKWKKLFDTWYKSGTAFHSIDSIDGQPNAIFQKWLKHPVYDSYWQRMAPYREDFERINIPVLTMTGYFDDDQRGAMYYYTQHHLWNKKADHYLLIGPWDHYGAQGTAAAELYGYTIDPVANIDVNETTFQWFDHILKGGPLPAMLKGTINYEVAGNNQWRSAKDMKALSNDSLVFYLDDKTTKTGYVLEEKKPARVHSIHQTIRYANRSVDDPQVMIMDTVLHAENELRFISEPLEKDIIMAGSFESELHIVINKKDVDLSVVLYELTPTGNYFNLSRSIARASLVQDPSRRQLLRPGKPETIDMTNSFFMSRKLSKGSRIIAVVGVNMNAGVQVNYGSGKDVSEETLAADGQSPLQIDWENGSYIKIPVLRVR